MTVKFTNVGGDPFIDEETLDAFAEDLRDAGADEVLLGGESYGEHEGIHDRPVTAVGLDVADAEEVWSVYKDAAQGLAGRAGRGGDSRVFHKLSENELETWELDAMCLESKAWVPYVGPQGGEGWQDTSTGDIVYDDEPPGERAAEGLDDASEEELIAAVGEVFDEESAESMEGMSADEIRQVVQGRADPEELEDVGDALESSDDVETADAPDVNEDAEYFEGADMDMRERMGIVGQESDPDGSTILFDHVQHEVKENVKEISGEPEAAEELFGLMEEWREDSFDEDAAQLERTFKEAFGLDGDVRGDFETSEPTEGQREAARAIAGASRKFFREEFGESRQLKRGVGQEHRDQMLDDYLTEGEVSVDTNATDNYSAYDKAPRYFAENTGAIIQPEVEADDVAAATESLFIKEKGGFGDEYIIDPPSEIDLTETRLAAPVSSVITDDSNYEQFSDDPNDMEPEFVAALAESYDGDEPEAFGEWLSGMDTDGLTDEQLEAIGEYT